MASLHPENQNWLPLIIFVFREVFFEIFPLALNATSSRLRNPHSKWRTRHEDLACCGSAHPLSAQHASGEVFRCHWSNPLEPGEIDEDFGVVAIDPERNDYTILVEQGATQKIKANENWDISGPYSNPRIETFGLQES